MNVPGLTVIELVNARFAAPVDYRNYRLLKKSSGSDDDVAQKLHKMSKKIVVQMKYCTIFGKDPISLINFRQEFKAACDEYEVHKGSAMWVFRQFSTGSAETAVKALVTLTNATNVYQEGTLKSYSVIVKFLLKHYIMDDDIRKLDVKVRNPREG